MAETVGSPGFDEFQAAVKRYFRVSWPDIKEDDVDKYLASDEAMFEITHRYNTDLPKMEAGEMTRDQLVKGVASSVGYCLALMY